ncbi:hypothetical protein X773_33900 [Mesorhizobium sp. LSJC285A00]|uniref:hypothetical protein n=1 Tax=Mesorhizobium sp. LSJC285A00 TaxID=1287338 RepID=UPI0003CF4F48|nr:hypothetical protein [Mesorhizobium sp. LSJC285A00]ESW63054.1 hypothetical protein X773_33900 [Mesorhizobium sp. LSJC285A00]
MPHDLIAPADQTSKLLGPLVGNHTSSRKPPIPRADAVSRVIARIPGATERSVHVGDRESDICELYCIAQDLGTSFIVRVQKNRLAARPADAAPHDPAHRVFAQLAAAPWAGRHRITVDQEETTWLRVKFAAINTLPPVGKRYSPQVLAYIHALEENPPPCREPIDWKLGD